MKKILLMIGMFWLFSLSVNAQTDEERAELQKKMDQPLLRKMSEQFAAEFNANYKKALFYAKINHWPLFNKGGSLYGITDDLKPMYVYPLNLGAGITSRASKLYTGGGAGLNLHGESMIVGVWEFSAPKLTHELLESRATTMDGSAFTNYDAYGIYTGYGDHATHVTGTVIGSDKFQAGRARGMAFKGNVWNYDFFTNGHSGVATAAASGLLISSHSYQDGLTPVYYSTPRLFDSIMYHAPYYLAVFAAGNDGPGSTSPVNIPLPAYDQLTQMACSKNGITVGNIYEVLNYTGPTDVVLNTASSSGPTDDYRIKPDLVAKGMNTFSSYGTSDNSYAISSGTSMCTPSVSGSLILLQQHYHNLNSSFMWSSTLRGLAIHTADEAGNNLGPDISYGWGLINVERAAKVITTNGVNSSIEERNLTNGGSYTETVTSLGTQPLVVTLAWTDPPGTIQSSFSTSPTLVNDLDLRVVIGGTTYYPWLLNTSNLSGAAIQGDNAVDNVEKIEIPSPGSTTGISVKVTHKGTLVSGSQNYSLIISGIGALGSCPSNVTITGAYSNTLTESQDWIKATGQTNISATSSVKLDADPVNGYVEMTPASSSDYFSANPTSTAAVFIAQAWDGCVTGSPARHAPPPPRPVHYYHNPPVVVQHEPDDITKNVKTVNSGGSKNILNIVPTPFSKDAKAVYSIKDFTGKAFLRIMSTDGTILKIIALRQATGEVEIGDLHIATGIVIFNIVANGQNIISVKSQKM